MGRARTGSLTQIDVDTLNQQDPENAQFFLQGAGGTGKTFLYKALCNHFRAQGQIVLCVASSGIAAELLPGGRTSHSRFQIPLVLHEGSMTMMTGGSHAAELIRRAGLIIWDEVPMQHKYCFEAVHRTLCDIRGNEHTFGGIPAILGGDWAQILPVVRHGNRAAIVRACLQNSFLWLRFRMLTLLATDLSTAGSLTDAVFTQTNNVRHTATHIQVPRYNEIKKQEEILFPAEHSRTNSKEKKSLYSTKISSHKLHLLPFQSLGKEGFVSEENIPFYTTVRGRSSTGQITRSG